MSKKLPTLATTRWNFTSRLVHTVYSHRPSLVDFLIFVYEIGDFDNVTEVKSKEFVNFFQENKNIFTIQIIPNILIFTNILFNILQSKHFDILFYSKKILDFKNQFYQES